MSIDKLKTKFSTGAWLPDFKSLFTKTNEIIDWINNISSTTVPSYKVYTALLSQSGTSFDNSDVTVLSNTTGGDITFSYVTDGTYGIELGSLFSANKIGIFIQPSGNSNDYSLGSIITTQYDGSTGYVLRTFSDPSTLSNKGLNKALLEIRIYN